jgi:glycosyltransferase involved in cell wall biosynthesis
MEEKLSIVISTYNRKKYLKYALQSLVEQSADKNQFEVLVIDNNSTDKTEEVVKEFVNRLPLKYFLEKKQGVSNARNKGIKESKYNFIAFLDDDAKASEKWVKNALNLINEKKLLIFGGPIYPYYEDFKPSWFKDEYEIRKNGETPKKLSKKNYISGSNIFFNKKTFDIIGLFNPKLGPVSKKMAFGEETKLQIIADNKNIDRFYYPEIFIYHLAPKWKMKISYIFKRSWISQRSSVKIFPTKGKFYIFVGSIYKFIIGLIYLTLLPFRNKEQYPFWQNYIVEKVIPNITYLGKIKGLLSK